MSQQSNPATLRELAIEWYRRATEGFAKKKLSAKAARQLRQCADELADLGAASGTEAAPCEVCNAPREIAGGEHVCGLSASAAYSLGFARGINSQPAQAAASPEGEGRDMPWTPEVEAFRAEMMRRFFNKLTDFSYWSALRQSAAPSGPLDTPSKLSSSMASAPLNAIYALVDMADHTETCKEEFATYDDVENCECGMLRAKEAVSQWLRAVAMTDEAPQQLQAESKTGAVTDAQAKLGTVNSVGAGASRGSLRDGRFESAPCRDSDQSIPESGETGAVTETK